MNKLKPREKQVYEYIARAISENGYAPSVRDIRDALGFKSTSTVHMYLERLEEYGLIRREDGKSRAISLAEEMPPGRRVPILGRVRAGIPILAEQNFDGYLNFTPPGRHSEEDQLFALRVSGDSMIGAGILDGDYVVVKKGDFAENGEIVVALLEDSATVKTFYKEKNGYRLQAENEAYAPILTSELSLLGRVIACLRFY